MNEISPALTRITRGLERLDRRVLLGELQAGLHEADIRAKLAGAALLPVEQLLELYAWRNGTRNSGASLDDVQIFPGFYLLSLDDALANYRAFVADDRWAMGWLPLFANGGGDFYVLDLSHDSEAPVRHFRIDEREHPVEYHSLGDFINTIAEAFARSVFFVDERGFLEMDDLQFAGLAAELNPEVPWWRG
jgi:cell wall assembly regulator SMI1